ncbi:MAG TPA: PRC-barrel domain-containing protein [Xanthobacteraceae bacterium]|nr:PRC-barrel domain-containing protein [Xanthobacteraceae bacterium]
MIRKLMVATAVSGLALSTAWAQSPPTSPSPSAPPSVSQGSESSPGSTATTGVSESRPGTPNVIAAQQPQQWLASKFKGTNVIGPDDQKIGDVSDILFDKNGKIDALVVGVGGFLGIGSKDVALSMNSFQVVPGENGKSDQLKLSMNKDQLKQAAEFKPYNPPSTTTGSGSSSGTTRPTGGSTAR